MFAQKIECVRISIVMVNSIQFNPFQWQKPVDTRRDLPPLNVQNETPS